MGWLNLYSEIIYSKQMFILIVEYDNQNVWYSIIGRYCEYNFINKPIYYKTDLTNRYEMLFNHFCHLYDSNEGPYEIKTDILKENVFSETKM